VQHQTRLSERFHLLCFLHSQSPVLHYPKRSSLSQLLILWQTARQLSS
jgi:hypothetical protein